MDPQLFYKAFEERNVNKLEELAEKTGYREKFEPTHTKLMLYTRPLNVFSSAEEVGLELEILKQDIKDIDLDKINEINQRIKEMGEKIKQPIISEENLTSYYMSQEISYKFLHPLLSAIKRKRPIDYKMGESPRLDWNRKYKDMFTRIKETDNGVYFVDCWQVKGSEKGKKVKDKIVIMKGKFVEEWYDMWDKRLDKETTRLLNLARLREDYPPYSRLKILFGPNFEWIFGRAILDTYLFFITYGSFKLGSTEQIGLYLGGAFTLGAEIGTHILFYKNLGKGVYKKQGVKLGKEAIDDLIKEATKI